MKLSDIFNQKEQRLLGRVCLALAIVMIVLYIVVPKHKPGAAPFVPAPEVKLEDYRGQAVSLRSYRLKPLIVYSWASWSPYSAEEFLALMELKRMYGAKITIVAVNRAEPLAEAKSYTDKLKIPEGDIVLALDPTDSYYKSIEGYAMPETIFISASGDETRHQRGPLKIGDLDTAVREML